MNWEVWDMNSKISFFNKSFFKSDIKRFWWIGVIETLLLLLTVTIPTYDRCTYAINDLGYSGYISPSWNGSIAVLFIFSIAVATLLFSYMHFSASVSGIHSFPMRRGTLFSTKVLSGIVLTVTPVVINGLLLLGIIINPEFRGLYSAVDVLVWLYTGMMYTLVIFSLSAIVNMMTGNPIGTIVFTCGFTALPAMVYSFFTEFFENEFHGYVRPRIDSIMDYIYISEKNVSFFVIYIILTAIFLSGAYLLYKKRKLENHGEVIAFIGLKPLFIGIVALFSSMFSYAYISGITDDMNILNFIPIGVVGTVIAWMISRKSIKLKGVWKPIIAYLVITGCFCSVIHFDLTGFESRIPDVDKIKEASIVDTMEYSYYGSGHYMKYEPAGRMSRVFTEKEDFEKVTALHKHIVSRGEISNCDLYLPFKYVLKNGQVIEREYRVSYEKDAEFLKPLFETPQIKSYFFELLDGTERDFTSLVISDRRKGENTVIYPDNENLMRLYEALKKDLEEMPYEEYIKNSGASTSIQLTYDYTDIITDSRNDKIEYSRQNRNESYYVKSSFKNTMAILNEIGYYNGVSAENITQAEIKTWKSKEGNPEAVSYVKEGMPVPDDVMKDAVTFTTTDPSEIQNLYSVYDNMIEIKNFSDFNNRLNILISYTLDSGIVFQVSCSYDAEKIPQELTGYFEGV